MVERLLGILAACASLAGCDRFFGLQGAPLADGAIAPDEDPAGEVRRTLRVDHRSPEDLVDFPVSVVIENDERLAMRARPDGSDIRFQTVEGFELPVEIVSYENGTLNAFVRTTLRAAAPAAEPTRIVLVYGGEPRLRQFGEAWGPRFAHVWHLDGNDANEIGSVSPASDLTSSSVPVESGDGMIGGARIFSDAELATNRPSLCQNGVSTTWPPVAAFSLSMWFNATAPPVDRFATPFEAGGYTAGKPGVAIAIDDQAAPGRVLALLTDSDSDHQSFELAPEVAYGEWHHYAFTYRQAAKSMALFVDGQRIGTTFPSSLDDDVVPAEPACLGGDDGFTGAIDEVRLFDEAISGPWFAAEHANVAERARFIVLED